MPGIIVKIIGDLYTVKSNDKYYDCRVRGKFRNQNITPLVGDDVVFDIKDKVIYEIKTRKNVSIRPPISNVDQIIIVVSAIDPVLNLNLLDKMLVIASFNNISPVICFTKLDLVKGKQKNEIKKYMKYYKKIGYKIVTNKQLRTIKKLLKGKITVLSGQSGVGKSSLLNKLLPVLNLKTGVISKSLGRGKHTTRHVELFELNHGLIADTPGFTSLDFHEMSKEDIRDNIVEFNNYKEKCLYQDCFHIREEDCQIKKMVNLGKIMTSRYENYKKFVSNK